jgi:hypothetical protein
VRREPCAFLPSTPQIGFLRNFQAKEGVVT